MVSADPGSLDRLNDIVPPPAPPWWPPAPAWYVVGALVLVLVTLLTWQLITRWNRNRYRREALAKLKALGDNAPLAAVAELVKRVALACYPRDRVASLTGEEWLRFLDESGQTTAFAQGAGLALGDAEYAPGSQAASPELLAAVRHWIRHHRTDRPC
jgi:hypothetical protein